MTKEQAIEAMGKGEKVTHRFFDAHEFITMKGTIYIDEMGYSLSPNAFWAYRTSEEWETDWSVYQEKK